MLDYSSIAGIDQPAAQALVIAACRCLLKSLNVVKGVLLDSQYNLLMIKNVTVYEIL
ncbi:hypothetical protein GCM10011369_36420 [Neiella marina]|uniref:Uncharacterized protein n=1 Tax=Neiella marina TaxID=508461 RepID=A0A8J2UBB5_9GAMM|nr:hypothetical protein GCM10011369_36420 [Neiella marina]